MSSMYFCRRHQYCMRVLRRELSTCQGAGPWYDAQSGALVKPDRQGALKLPVTMDDVPSYLRGGHILPLRVRSWILWQAMALPCSCLRCSLSAGASNGH